MKKKNIIVVLIAIIALILLALIASVTYYHREQSFLEILPEIPEFEPEMVQIMRTDRESAVPMSKELFDDFVKDMDKFKYKHVTTSFGMDSFGRIIYLSNGNHVEIMFSNERGGSILVNPLDENGNEPIYKIIGSDNQLEKMFDAYLDKATR